MNTSASFSASFGAGYNATVAVTTSSASTTLTPGGGVLRIANGGASAVGFAVGTSPATVTAVLANGPVILPGSTEVFSIPVTADTIALIGAGASTVYLSRGEGV